MVTFLFWNLNQKPLQETITDIAFYYGVDVLIFVECAIQPDILLRTLNRDKTRYHYAPGIGCTKVKLYTQFESQLIEPVLETNRLTVRHMNLPGVLDILLACVHLPSKQYWKESSQTLECVDLADSLKLAEQQIGHSRTILVGDLNMNPFEDGVVSAKGLHGIMSRRIAQKKSRVVQGKEYPFFYNPMWSFFGDRNSNSPGTYYHTRSEHTVFFWNIFDQVLIRPALLPFFDVQGVEIIQSYGSASLLSPEGWPDADGASDHLPVLFSLNL